MNNEKMAEKLVEMAERLVSATADKCVANISRREMTSGKTVKLLYVSEDDRGQSQSDDEVVGVFKNREDLAEGIISFARKNGIRVDKPKVRSGMLPVGFYADKSDHKTWLNWGKARKSHNRSADSSSIVKKLVEEWIDDSWTTAEESVKREAKRNLRSRARWNGSGNRMEYLLGTTWEDDETQERIERSFFVTVGEVE